jgi:WD40 repeat protein
VFTFADPFNFVNVSVFRAHENAISRIKQSPLNEGYVATCSSNLNLNGSADFSVKVWFIMPNSNWSLIKAYRSHSNRVEDIEWLSKNKIASVSVDGTIRIWPIRQTNTRATDTTHITINVGVNVYASSVRLLSNGIHLAAGISNGHINIYNIYTGDLVYTLSGHTTKVLNLISINNTFLASSSEDATIRIWDITQRVNAAKFKIHGNFSRIFGLKFITANILASVSNDNTIRLWNTESGVLMRNLTGHTNKVYSVDILRDGQTIITGSWDSTLKLWNISTGQVLSTLETGFSVYSSLSYII